MDIPYRDGVRIVAYKLKSWASTRWRDLTGSRQWNRDEPINSWAQIHWAIFTCFLNLQLQIRPLRVVKHANKVSYRGRLYWGTKGWYLNVLWTRARRDKQSRLKSTFTIIKWWMIQVIWLSMRSMSFTRGPIEDILGRRRFTSSPTDNNKGKVIDQATELNFWWRKHHQSQHKTPFKLSEEESTSD